MPTYEQLDAISFDRQFTPILCQMAHYGYISLSKKGNKTLDSAALLNRLYTAMTEFSQHPIPEQKHQLKLYYLANLFPLVNDGYIV